MQSIRIERRNGGIVLINENGRESKIWGPRMVHKGFNVYNGAIKLLKGFNEIEFAYDGDTNYVLRQPDLFLISRINVKNKIAK